MKKGKRKRVESETELYVSVMEEMVGIAGVKQDHLLTIFWSFDYF